ncbi:MAG: peptide-methionine (S)-S-oxide reductase MsrA [Hyphomicrobiaceae bacterium]
MRVRLLGATLLGVIVGSASLVPSIAGDKTAAKSGKLAVATFAAGCFWCTESDFDKVKGVVSTTSGFMGGRVKNPTYRQVVRGGTGHTEVLQVKYNPSVVSYKTLLKVFWRNVDPFDKDGQFCDRGNQYRPEIFVHTREQEKLAKASKASVISANRFKNKVIVPVTKASAFTAAEKYHQNFYKKNPAHYWRYRIGCGRDRRLEQIWGKKAKS